MASINDNLLVKGARGNIGKQLVYRKHGKGTTIARMPRVNPHAEPTSQQQGVREQFTSAIQYARGILQSAELKKEYGRKAGPGKTAFNMATRDFLKPPVVKKINTSAYNGTPGSQITVHAKDDFRVTAVKVGVYTAAGKLLEEGNAVLNPVNLTQWLYTAAKVNTAPQGLVVKAVATDLPGNTGMLEVTV